jgi:hypothetical protein
MQPSSVPVDRWAKSMELMQNCCCAPWSVGCAGNRKCARWFRSPARAMRTRRAASERERNSLLSESAYSIASMPCQPLWACKVIDPLRRNQRWRLASSCTALRSPLPANARAKIARMLDRLKLSLQ